MLRSSFLAVFAVLGLGLLASAPSLAPAPPPAGTYALDASHSGVEFRIRHLGLSTVRGSFNDFSTSIAIPDGTLASLSVEATIQTASIDTGNGDRDNHLRSPDFFDATNKPTITFRSKRVAAVEGNQFQLVGDLTMNGVTREVTLDAEYQGEAQGMRGDTRIGFMAEGRINRKDFGLTWNRALEAGGLLVGEDVSFAIEIQAIKQP